MNFKKLLSFVLCMVLVFALASCESGGGGGGNQPKEGDYWDADGNGTPDWQEKECTLKFLTWAYNDPETVTIDVVMADAFMAKYPNITIEFITAGEENQEYNYDPFIVTLMEAGELPDVFLVRRLESVLGSHVLADITEMFENDPDSNAIFDSVKASGTYNDRRYAVSTYIYPQFWVVNKTLLAEKNIPIPSYDWTWDQMEAIARQATDTTKHYIGLYGRQGYYGEGATAAYTDELPKILKMEENVAVGKTWAGWAYDGNRFNFDDPVFLTAMNKAKAALDEGFLSAALSVEQKEEYYGAQDFVPTTGGKVAVWREASWSFKDEISKIEFEWDIYPGPSGVTGGNTDLIGISSLSPNKQAAYQFMKWMSFGEDGILSRFEIYRESGSELFTSGNNYPYPIADYGIDGYGVNKIWDNIPYGDTAPGLVSPQYLEALRNGAYKLNKEVCGWDNVDSQVGPYLEQVYSGESTFAALVSSIQTAANLALAETRAAIDIALSL